MKMFCSKCHCARNGSYCRLCGEKLINIEAIPKCKCGSTINWEDRYCPNCGRPIPNTDNDL